MKQTGKVAVGKVVLRDREDLVAVFPHEDGLVLQKLHYPHELRKMEDVPDLESVQKLDATETKQERIETRHDAGAGNGDDACRDRYGRPLSQGAQNLIDSKIKGKKVVEFEVEEVPRLDIMSALKKSLQASNRKPMVKAPATTAKEETADHSGETASDGERNERLVVQASLQLFSCGQSR